MPPPRHDYDQLITYWMTRPDGDRGARPEDRLGLMRADMESSLREGGLDGEGLARELAHFDAAATRILGSKVAQGATPQPHMAPVEEADHVVAPATRSRARLGIWGRIATVWVSLTLALGAVILVGGLLMPLHDAGRITRAPMAVPAAIVGALVFVAALLFVARLIREYRELGVVLFWAPLVLVPYAITAGAPILLQLFTRSMGEDFLPLAIPLAVLVGGVLSAGALFTIRRHLWPGSRPQATKDGPGPIQNAIVAIFLVIFFTIGAQKMLGWGSGPSVVGGILVTCILLRGLLEREVTILVPIAITLPLTLLAAELPPSGLSALTVLVASLAAGAVVSLVTILRGSRRTTLASSFTAAALALVLVIAPSAPALWLADRTGHLLRPAAASIMGGYQQLYATDLGRSVIAAVAGFRSGAAVVRVDWRVDNERARPLVLRAEVTNAGESGISEIQALFREAQYLEDPGCGDAVARHLFDQPLWPGDSTLIDLEVGFTEACPAALASRLSDEVLADLRKSASMPSVEARVLGTVANDPRQRFASDARAWLGL